MKNFEGHFAISCVVHVSHTCLVDVFIFTRSLWIEIIASSTWGICSLGAFSIGLMLSQQCLLVSNDLNFNNYNKAPDGYFATTTRSKEKVY